MISLQTVHKFCCEDVSKIENYDKAISDTSQTWHCHHRMELMATGAVVDSTVQDLIDWNIYYDRPADELIFLTPSEHAKLHRKYISDEHREKISTAKKGHEVSEETKRKIRSKNTGRPQSDETRAKRSASKKGKPGRKGCKWYTNGKVCVMDYSCPEGFWPGRIGWAGKKEG